MACCHWPFKFPHGNRKAGPQARGEAEIKPEDWIKTTKTGLYCVPGDFFIDPHGAVDRAVVTHGHADHARPGHGAVLATRETRAIVAARYGDASIAGGQDLSYGETVTQNGVEIRMVPAGHVLGSAQAVLSYKGQRVVVSGDYKRRADETCAPFEPIACDVFITEATFALPVFRHPDDAGEVAKLLHSVQLFPDRVHMVGVYGLGKCQRLIRLLRRSGYDKTLYLHGAMIELCALYESLGVALGPVAPISDKKALGGEIVLCPPGSLADKWSRGFPDPVTAMASGWMGVRQRARQRGVELPLIISDHADWDELTTTLEDVDPPRLWVTHGREEALVHAASLKGIEAEALSLVGYEEEGGE